MEQERMGSELYLRSRVQEEWDPKHWKWDGDLFIATPTLSLNQASTATQTQLLFTNSFYNISSSSSGDEKDNLNSNRGDQQVDKKRPFLTVEEEDEDSDEAASGRDLTALNLGVRGGYPNDNNNTVSGKKTKSGGAVCQVQDCGADLSKAKDYHRRHKVCEIHSKVTKALVANQMQRFCQQCSRFHLLQEFDEGKRSCRRRLAGHNKRRRKTQPGNLGDSNANPAPSIDNQANGYLVMAILKILSSIHSNRSNHTEDQALLSHLLQSLANQGSSGDLPDSLKLLNNLSSLGNAELVSALLLNGSLGQTSRDKHCTAPIHEKSGQDRDVQVVTSQSTGVALPSQPSPHTYTQEMETSGRRVKLNDFDLNDVYVDTNDGTDDTEKSPVPTGLETVSVEYPLWMQQDSHQSSPPQTSRNSDSASAQSPSSSTGIAQNYTDRIVFKLFGKEPNDLPLVLRSQVFDWLSQSPSDIESYIRPGCVILTIYLRQEESAWEELCFDLRSSLSRLLNFSDDVGFWNNGWIYVMVQNQMAFIHNGQVVADACLTFETGNYSTILNVRPIAVASSTQTQFLVKGLNLSRPSTRLLCALEGSYLQGDNQSVEHVDGLEGQVQCLKISYSVPALTGRGFIEIEEHGLGRSFFPFIVAEDNVCTEIRTLEKELEKTEMDYLHQEIGSLATRNKAMEFIHEMGWILHKFQSKSRHGQEDPISTYFPFERFKYLVEFAIDRDWCAVVNQLLDILLDGVVSCSEQQQPLLTFALSDLSLLHRAVRRNSRSLVEMLLRYVPVKVATELSSEYKSLVKDDENYLFRPDVVGPEGLTPLHVAAARDGSEETLDALTEDPGKAGIGAWKNALDSAGFTPEHYARLRGHYSYIHLVQRKINKKPSSSSAEHVVVDIFDTAQDSSTTKHKSDDTAAPASFGIIGKSKAANALRPCSICCAHNAASAYRTGSPSLAYRPAMLSMLAVAAVCVCVALYFKTLPHVLYMFHPFRWEMLEYGAS